MADHRVGQLAILGFELTQRENATGAWVQIEADEVTDRTRRDCDVGNWMVDPPLSDLLESRGGLFNAMPRQRVLSGMAAIIPATGASAVSHGRARHASPARHQLAPLSAGDCRENSEVVYYSCSSEAVLPHICRTVVLRPPGLDPGRVFVCCCTYANCSAAVSRSLHAQSRCYTEPLEVMRQRFASVE
jgi:hypothetical protein